MIIKQYSVRCNTCRTVAPGGGCWDSRSARNLAARAGWKRIPKKGDSDGADVCPDCQRLAALTGPVRPQPAQATR